MHKRTRCFALVLACASSNLAAADLATVDTGGTGRKSSIAIGADGLPVVAYRDAAISGGRLLFAKCESPDCSSAIREGIEDANGNAHGEHSSLLIAPDGHPLVAWYDTANQDLAIARCANLDCSGDDLLRTLDGSIDDAGRYASMVLDATGRPLVAYLHSAIGATSLRLAHCQTPSCANATVNEVDAGSADVRGIDADVVLGIDGLPIIAYLNDTTDSLETAKCLDEGCSNSLVALIEPQVEEIFGLQLSIALAADGNPIISFIDQDDEALKVAHCGDPACLGPKTITALQDESGARAIGSYCAIAIRPDGAPVISFQFRALDAAGGGRGLAVAECTDTDCSGEVRVIDVDFRPGEVTGTEPDIVIGRDGGAVISYYDSTGLSLKVAKCNTQSCQGPGDRVFSDGFE